jgi:hypothetical protein
MAKILENPNGRRAIRLNTDDIFMIVSLYQQYCNSKCLTYDEARSILASEKFYLPEEL